MSSLDISETEFRISLTLDVAEEDSGGASEPRGYCSIV